MLILVVVCLFCFIFMLLISYVFILSQVKKSSAVATGPRGRFTGSGGVAEPAADVVVTSDPLPGDSAQGLSSAPGPTSHLLSL